MIDPELLADLQADLRRLVNIMKLPEWQRDLIASVPDRLVKEIAAVARGVGERKALARRVHPNTTGVAGAGSDPR
jgi:hypothetical protein